MKIRLRKKDRDFAMVHRNLLFDTGLKLASKGLGALIEYYSDGYEVSFATIAGKSKDGKGVIKSSLAELAQEGYLAIVQSKDELGRFMTTWIFDSEGLEKQFVIDVIYECNSPTVKRAPWPDLPTTANPSADIPKTGTKPNNKNISDQKRDKQNTLSFSDFRKAITEKYEGMTIPIQAQFTGWRPETTFSIHLGYLVNDVTGKPLTKEDAFQIWEKLFNHRNLIGGDSNEKVS